MRNSDRVINLRCVMRMILWPLSAIFGIVTFIRNLLYDIRILPSIYRNDVMIISTGNITVGGTGKTPFVEYLIETLARNYQIAVLSRGYGRISKGFHFVDNQITVENTGDEPFQIKNKFPHIVVAVDVDRVEGVNRICATYPDIQIILLDDAFQYRKICPSLSILLADYGRPMYRDGMLPGGRLREWAKFARRADLMIITKVPFEISDEEQHNAMQRYANIFPHNILFTTVKYGMPCPVFSEIEMLYDQTVSLLNQSHILLLTGIANPAPLEKYVQEYAKSVAAMHFADHHRYTAQDIRKIVDKWKNMPQSNRILLTTEKDAVRLRRAEIPAEIAKCSYYLPIEVKFIGDGRKYFEQQLYACANGFAEKSIQSANN